LEWLSRSSQHIGCRAVLLVDAKAVLGAVVKGRSSAQTFKRIIGRISAISMAMNITLHLLYVPTECNPADAPSRGLSQPQRRVTQPSSVIKGHFKPPKR
jgi:hypothetical protein